MNNLPKIPINSHQFLRFVLLEARNRRMLIIAVVGALVQFTLFKYFYPYPDFFSDSYSYIYAAYANLDVSIWPIGYSKFLRLFHSITHSSSSLVAFQYFFMEISSLYLFFSILFLFVLSKTKRTLLFLFLFFNPLFLYINNYINSDPLFLSFSILWFTSLLWIIYRPTVALVVLHSILLFICFSIRNNAYYYPLIGLLAFILAPASKKFKLFGICAPLLLLAPFIIHTRSEAYKLTGTRQFSLFTGWQQANNALYMFEYVDTAKNLPNEVIELDKLATRFYRHVDSNFHSNLPNYVGNFFIREPNSPLKVYMNSHYKYEGDSGAIVAWGKSSAVFSIYGNYLIQHNLGAYLHEFVMPNMKNYFLPPLEKLELYNLGLDEVAPIAESWFDLKSASVTSISKTAQGTILYLFPVLFLALNFLFAANLILYWLFDFYKQADLLHNKTLLLTTSLWLLNLIFCSCATIVVFRYEVFPMITILFSYFELVKIPSKPSSKNLNINTEGYPNYSRHLATS